MNEEIKKAREQFFNVQKIYPNTCALVGFVNDEGKLCMSNNTACHAAMAYPNFDRSEVDLDYPDLDEEYYEDEEEEEYYEDEEYDLEDA